MANDITRGCVIFIMKMIQPRSFLVTALLIGQLYTLVVGSVALASTPTQPPQRLKMINDFKTAEEVVRYYCARDAAGFIWAGMIDQEVREFTVWDRAPSQDIFFLARKYEVGAAKQKGTEAWVEVKYNVSAVSDRFSTRTPTEQANYSVQFVLKQVGKQWKIVKPDPALLAPVVVE